jgi:hypothetical protein
MIALPFALAFSALTPTLAAAPSVTQQPAFLSAAPGEDITFTVAATGDAPLAYQWSFDAAALAGQTNSALLLTNVTAAQSGTYSITITNAAGSTNYLIGTLNVTTNAFRQLGIGNIAQTGSSVVVPITLSGNRHENAISFSLAYDTNAFSNPVWGNNYPTANASADTSTPGIFGVAVTLPPGEMFNSTNREIGTVLFALAPGKSIFDGRLAFTNAPIPIAGVTANGTNFAVLTGSLLQLERLAAPTLNLQSGLFEHRILIANPAAVTMTNLNILVADAGFDSRTNAIRLYNGQFTDTVLVTNLVPGESRVLTIEFYVPDHVTVPNPKYLVSPFDFASLSLPPTVAKTLAVDVTRYLTNSTIVEFSTQLGRQYFIQYANTTDALVTGKVVFPSVIGTGSRIQWIDNGPPKTDSPPTNQTRFYRILTDER